MVLITPYIAISINIILNIYNVSENITKIHFLLYHFCVSCKLRIERILAHAHVLRKWNRTSYASERTVSFKGSEELCEVEYLETIGDGDYIESTSEGEVLSSGHDNDSEMLQTVFEGIYSTSFVSTRNDPVERDSLLLFDKNLMDSDAETSTEGSSCRLAS